MRIETHPPFANKTSTNPPESLRADCHSLLICHSNLSVLLGGTSFLIVGNHKTTQKQARSICKSSYISSDDRLAVRFRTLHTSTDVGKKGQRLLSMKVLTTDI
ncbi:hypothetical protein LEP1GSC103_0598 [Leptospira borgpetersenii serovar Javanica str. UI 09931]|uniref:Uncharacterized protein n=1 Tax=Leptospira borgpetersenii serovar Javanica str. UI 09931 TaxID=1049767 RepID=A0AAV3J676_LEPBO|nr:hypothetical protein C4Q31_18155 [Leptospira borgpetersenii serovar Ceylonica]EPG55873.1 hypothetical protein LEP1GSC103_0598 [Leptospira borgpetersenii serovar Javanica str. UI 09931]